MDFECQSIAIVINWPLSNKNNFSFVIKVKRASASNMVKGAGKCSEWRTAAGSLLCNQRELDIETNECSLKSAMVTPGILYHTEISQEKKSIDHLRRFHHHLDYD